MDDVPPAPENAPLIRYGFAAVFIAACLYDLTLGIRVAGVFLLGLALYEGLTGRVPMVRFWQTKSYVRGPIAMAIVISTVCIGAFFALAPGLVLRLVAMMPD